MPWRRWHGKKERIPLLECSPASPISRAVRSAWLAHSSPCAGSAAGMAPIMMRQAEGPRELEEGVDEDGQDQQLLRLPDEGGRRRHVGKAPEHGLHLLARAHGCG